MISLFCLEMFALQIYWSHCELNVWLVCGRVVSNAVMSVLTCVNHPYLLTHSLIIRVFECNFKFLVT